MVKYGFQSGSSGYPAKLCRNAADTSPWQADEKWLKGRSGILLVAIRGWFHEGLRNDGGTVSAYQEGSGV